MGEIYLGENDVFTAAMGGAILKKKKNWMNFKISNYEKKTQKIWNFQISYQKEKRLEMA